jgi:hypothetical protein
MISEFTGIHKLTMETILNVYGKENLKNSIANSDLFGIGYWSIGPHMTSIFKGLNDLISESIPESKKLRLFFDLADVKKKPVEDLRVALAILRDFCSFAEVTVSVNDKEAESLALALDIELLKKQDQSTNFEVTGESVPNRKEAEFTPPVTYCQGLKRALLGEQNAVQKYRQIMYAMQTREHINMMLEIITDELRHGILYNYLYSKNGCSD